MKDKIRYVNKSTYRLKVVKSLNTEAKMPREISADCDILPNHISNVLKQLRENELVECINPEVKKGRLYRLSDEGLEVFKKLE